MQPQAYTRLSDFKTIEVSGTTHGTADTSRKFRHGANAQPSFWIVQEGNVYIPANGVGPNEVDVRSASSSTDFRVLLFF